MELRVSYFGPLRAKAGVKSEGLEIEGSSTLGDLLGPLCRKRGIHAEVFGESETSPTSVNILLNGRNVRFLKGMETPLGDGDRISIFPPTGGG